MPDKALDPVEWEIVLADIAMEKARLKANGDWARWEEFQKQTNITRAVWIAGPARARPPMSDPLPRQSWWRRLAD